jgi:hypothetical protein
MKPDQVLIVIDDELKRIWIWKGADAPVRKKFIAARSAQGIRATRGLVYKIISEDAGEEDEEFLQAVGQVPTARPDAAAATTPDSSVAAPTESTPKPPQPKAATTPQPKPDYTRVVTARTAKTTQQQSVKVPHSSQEIIEQVKQLEPVPGFRREFVLIGFDAFAITEEATTLLGKRTVTQRLQRIDSLPEGVLFAQGYTPRIVIENGQVLAVEFLKQVQEQEYQVEKRHLAELVRSSGAEASR